MGEEKKTCCHPLSLSLVNVAVPRRVPVEVQILPKWVPVFVAAL
jgi:hypothetical protein